MARTTRLLTAALPASSPRSKSCDFLSAFRLPFGCAPIFARPSDKRCARPTKGRVLLFLEPKHHTRLCVRYPFSGVSVQKPLCQSGKRQVCPEPLRLLLLCVGLGIPASSDYPHTDAEPIVCVGMGILKPGHYSRTYVNLGVCVGMGILKPGHYSRTYAILGVCVVLGMLKPCQYSQTAAKAHAGRLM